MTCALCQVWVPLYGAPQRTGVTKFLSDRWSQARTRMSRLPDTASAYRCGVVLVGGFAGCIHSRLQKWCFAGKLLWILLRV